MLSFSTPLPGCHPCTGAVLCISLLRIVTMFFEILNPPCSETPLVLGYMEDHSYSFNLVDARPSETPSISHIPQSIASKRHPAAGTA